MKSELKLIQMFPFAEEVGSPGELQGNYKYVVVYRSRCNNENKKLGGILRVSVGSPCTRYGRENVNVCRRIHFTKEPLRRNFNLLQMHLLLVF